LTAYLYVQDLLNGSVVEVGPADPRTAALLGKLVAGRGTVSQAPDPLRTGLGDGVADVVLALDVDPGALDAVVGEAASGLYADATRMLEQLIEEKWLRARAVVGFFAANSSADDDITVYTDESRQAVKARLHHLRQQKSKPANQPQSCLADFVAPIGSGRADYIGAFAVTAGLGIDEHVARFEAAHDDYSSIMLKALADRLAEALAERMHERVRRELWGYAPQERLDGNALIREQYQGIRPAPGYPACPEHTEKATLWKLLDPQKNAGIRLTESFAMFPTAAVSGFYFSHPEAHYFGVGQIDRDQVASYAQRKGWTRLEAERWLAPNLGYEPDQVKEARTPAAADAA